MVALPIVGAVLLGPVGIALGIAGTLAVKHGVKPAPVLPASSPAK